jgi:5-methylcytosine-specific restriction endonuclease McrA
MGMKPAQRAAHDRLNAERRARGLRPVRRGRKVASPLPRRSVDRAGYREYIHSEMWQKVRRRFWASRLPKSCYVCGREDGPKDLHHRTYKNLGNENLRDLVPLCRRCHDEVHALYDSNPRLSLWGATGALRAKYRKISRSTVITVPGADDSKED